MAGKQDLDFTYTVIDKIFRMSIGETGDFSGARYNGDFSMSIEPGVWCDEIAGNRSSSFGADKRQAR